MVVRVNGRVVQREGGGASVGDTHGPGISSITVEGKGIATVGQFTLGHEGFPPTVAVEGSDNVRAAGLPVMRSGDSYAPHTRGDSVHTDVATP